MLIFVHIPKTGGTTACAALRYSGITVNHTHEPAIALSRNYPPKVWNDTLKVTLVRNPWDRAVSLYYWWHQDVPCSIAAFREWICKDCLSYMEEFDPLDQLAYLVDEEQNDLVDFIGRFENLQDDIKAMGRMANVVPGVPGHWSPSARPAVPYQEFYDTKTADMLADHTRPFIERFGYTFD